MITSEGNQKHDELIFKGDGFSDVLSTNGNGGLTIKKNQHTNFISTITGLPTYNVGFEIELMILYYSKIRCLARFT